MIFTVTILLLIGIIFINYNKIEQITLNEFQKLNKNSLYRTSDVMNTVFQEVNFFAAQIAQQPEVRNFMINNTLSYKIYDKIYSNIFRYIDSVYLYSEKYNTILTRNYENRIIPLNEFNDHNWDELYLNKKNEYSWIEFRKKNNTYPYLLTLFKPAYIYNYNQEITERIGTVIINIDLKILSKVIFNSSEKFETISVINNKGIIVASNDYEYIGNKINNVSFYSKIEKGNNNSNFNNQKYIYSMIDSKDDNYKYISALPISRYNNEIQDNRDYVLYILLIGIIVVIVITLFISIKTFDPMKNIISALEYPEYWYNKEKIIEKNSTNELRYIASKIVKLVYSNKELEEELKKRLYTINKTKFAALQAQINPHFLYNTVEAIKWKVIAISSNNNTVVKMIDNLSDLLHLTWDLEDNLIPIENEIEHAQKYLEIMKERYRDKFTIVWNIPQEIKRYKIVKLSIQPLLENAIYHGIKPSRDKGIIELSAELVDNDIQIKISDNGVGISDEEIKNINKELKQNYSLEENYHVGIRNVNQRIKLLMGEDYGLSVKKNFKNGVTFIILIPITY